MVARAPAIGGIHHRRRVVRPPDEMLTRSIPPTMTQELLVLRKVVRNVIHFTFHNA
jgi:hypothetical protein